MQDALERTADPAWLMEEHGYDPFRECCSESRFAIGNGFLGVRGARAVSRGPTLACCRRRSRNHRVRRRLADRSPGLLISIKEQIVSRRRHILKGTPT